MAVIGNGLRAFWLTALLACAGVAHADFSGQVVAILDGDTIDVLVDQRPVRVRLAQIDAPEKRQAFDTRSRQMLAGLVFQKTARVAEEGRDRYGRVIGTVFVSGVDVNARMVREGMAWVYRRYAKDKMLYELEDQAKVRRVGLWADPAPVAPWDYRRTKRVHSASGLGSSLTWEIGDSWNGPPAMCGQQPGA